MKRLLALVVLLFGASVIAAQTGTPTLELTRTGMINNFQPFQEYPFTVEADGSTVVLDVMPVGDNPGQLDTYLVRTGYRVTPIVGLIQQPQELAPDGYEVDAVFEVPLSFLMRPDARRLDSRTDLGRERFFYVFDYGEYDIWGATAGMLVNLVEVVGREA